ncbi:hypothetical protein DH2020_037106 [Rehmannia glutinosa]|uniref:UDP-glycosyltransferase n=1 Tax=Rehmannia glutinosa TaxID=99300 RepID=A0ABR0V1Y4_REHGL
MGKPHVMVVPCPAQGHVIPMLEFSQWLVKYGVQVTFVNTEFNHERILKSLSVSDNIQETLTMVSIPDGLELWEERDLRKVIEATLRDSPAKLESLIENINGSGEEKITCVIVDATVPWALEVAEKLGIRRAAFWTMPAAVLAMLLDIPKLMSDGVIDSNSPLLATNRLGKSAGYFWQDITSNVDYAYPKGFKDRVHKRGLMQWSSVPMLAIFGDRFKQLTYICDEWKIGLGLSKDESGIIRKGEIKDKLEHLLTDKSYKERALNLQEKIMDSIRGGSSHKNFNKFIE